MKNTKNQIPSTKIFIFIALFSFGITYIIYRTILSLPPIRSDGHGYYMYLPAFIIYHDPKMLFLDQIEDFGNFPATYYMSAKGAMVDKYTMGTALLQLPFFLCAHIATLLSDASRATGFTSLYEVANIVSAQFYYVVGAIFSHKIIKKYASEKYALISIILCTFGSNLFHYITYDSCFSHAYSFSLISIFIYMTIYLADKKSSSPAGLLFLLGLVYGLIVLVRVTDATIILFYIAYNAYNLETLSARLKYVFAPKNALIPIIGAVLGFMPQMIYWYIATGSLFINSYGGTDPGFIYVTSPKIGGVLFLVNQGIFFYCPLLLIATIGGFICHKKIQNILPAICIFSIVFIYVIASWWSYILPGYSNRIFINIMPIFMLFLAVMLENLQNTPKALRIIMYFLIFLAIAWNLLCMYGYWHGKLKYDYNTMEDIIKMLRWYLKKF